MPRSPLIIEPGETCNSSVIWLHGLGADGHDFEPVVAQLQPQVTSRTRYIFPHAPVQPVTINGGAEMPAWYDILDAQLERRVDAAGVERSTQTVNELIAAECDKGIDAGRIVIAGFSQGGAIALHAGLRYPQRLAGIMALSTYLPIREGTREQASKSNLETPILLAHGAQDPVVPLGASEDSRVFLRSLGYRVQSNTYPMEHSVSAEELRDISCWLENVLAL
ncbi:MAG: phospholipase/carboxylesterase [Gammaproteobacteria bacterium]|jgi:phospholipase/carboxylesterase